MAHQLNAAQNRPPLFPQRIRRQDPSDLQRHLHLPHLRSRQTYPRRNRASENVLLHVPPSSSPLQTDRPGTHRRIRFVRQVTARQFLRANDLCPEKSKSFPPDWSIRFACSAAAFSAASCNLLSSYARLSHVHFFERRRRDIS